MVEFITRTSLLQVSFFLYWLIHFLTFTYNNLQIFTSAVQFIETSTIAILQLSLYKYNLYK